MTIEQLIDKFEEAVYNVGRYEACVQTSYFKGMVTRWKNARNRAYKKMMIRIQGGRNDAD